MPSWVKILTLLGSLKNPRGNHNGSMMGADVPISDPQVIQNKGSKKFRKEPNRLHQGSRRDPETYQFGSKLGSKLTHAGT